MSDSTSAATHTSKGPGASGSGAADARAALTKVPLITAFFWLAKLLTTAMGEAASDFGNQALGPAIAVPLMLVFLVVALKVQLGAPAYSAWRYWMVVAAVGTFGTSAADALHVGLGMPYTASSAFYLLVLAAVFTAWYRSEGTLSIHSITTQRRERYYWATVLATFALGTALGDMTATNFGMGYLSSIVLFASLFAIPAVGYLRFGMNPVFAFWFAYVMTRPLGASIADWLDVSRHLGGLALGAGAVTAAFAVLFAALTSYLASTRLDVEGEPARALRPMLDVELD